MASCSICNDTGVEDTGNGDFPCPCGRGDRLLFNTERGQEVGIEVRHRYPGVTGARRAQAAGGPYRQEYQHEYPPSFQQRLRQALEPFELRDPFAAAFLNALRRNVDPQLLAVEALKSYAEQAAYLRDVAKRAMELQVPSMIVMKKDETPK